MRSGFAALSCDNRDRRRILSVMLSRLGALVLAAIVTGIPVSATACEILCAMRASAQPSGAVPRQSCHGTEPTGASARMSSQGHVCGHDADRLVSFGVTTDRLVSHPDPVAVNALPIPSVALVSLARRATGFSFDHHGSRVPLRI